MFTKSARFYDAVYSSKDYAAEADVIAEIAAAINPEARTLLDVACGTGLHLEQLRERYEVAGIDLDPEMVSFASARNPEADIRRGDMIDFDLGRTFDVITCLFSSIGYVRTLDGLERAMASMARHLANGGVLLIEPWIFPGDFIAGFADTLIVEFDEGKIVRAAFSDRLEDMSILDLHYLVRGADGEVAHFSERHILGLFERTDYEDAASRAGLDIRRFDPEGLMGRGLFVATRSG